MKNKNLQNRRVVVTGIGPLTAIGFGKDALWKSILNKQTGLAVQEFFVDGQLWDKFLLHKISNFDINQFKLEEGVISDILSWKKGKEDRDLFYLLAAIKLALSDSRLKYDRQDNNIGLFITLEHPGFETFCQGLLEETFHYIKDRSASKEALSKNEIFKHLYTAFVQNGYDLQSFMYLFLTAKAFDIHGYSLYTSNACASGLFAIEAAARQIKQGDSDIAIVAGGDYPCTMFKHAWFKERGFYAEDGKLKPFAYNADGIVFGDGASAIVLEDLNCALARDAQIYAEYMGGGFTLEGWKVTYPQVGSSSYQKAIIQALKASGLGPKDIDLINPHGVGIKVTDAYEAKAITDVFGKGNKNNLVTAFKPYVGHNLGGSAILETAILLLAMQHKVIPATLNCQDLEKKNNINLVREDTKHSLDAVMKLSCGFAGYNGAAVFTRFKK
jgi:3-oxoacyl-[acyl-carrier-protein] synthase II